MLMRTRAWHTKKRVDRRVWQRLQKNVERWAWTIRSTTPRQPRQFVAGTLRVPSA